MSDPRRPLARSEEPNEEIALAPRDVSHPRGLRPRCSVRNDAQRDQLPTLRTL